MAKIYRTKNAWRNIVFGLMYRLYSILLPFFMRSVIIYTLGVEYLGLDGLFSSILQVLNLAELGVGSALVYSMYEPISKDDTKTICKLLNLYKIYYRIIGFVVAVLGTILVPFIPILIKGSYPNDINIYIVYILNLLVTVISYWIFAYKSSILQALQREDYISKIFLISLTLKYLIQFAALLYFRNFYYYVIANLISQAVHNLLCAFVASKKYPNYKAEGKLDRNLRKDLHKRIKDLFTAKVAIVITGPTDTIIISAFLGLSVLAVFQNYNLIVNSIFICMDIIFVACKAGIGNSIITESKQKNYYDLKKLTFIILWISAFCMSCLICLFQPFMNLWMGPSLMFGLDTVIIFGIYFYVSIYNNILFIYKEAAGLWHQDRFRPLCVALVNLLLSIISVNYYGVNGVIISTVISYIFVGTPWLIRNLFSNIFEINLWKNYVKSSLVYTLVAVVAVVASSILCNFVYLDNMVMVIILRLLVCFIVVNLVNFIAFFKYNVFKDCLNIVKKIIS